ncbi:MULTISPECIES: FliA/WhiG family RNA polymerase sigma factor [Thermotoga]|uniref:RNA polymerase, sigma 28 subunit, FliA/WhiG n=1 Tax=Thermotoga neapolitana (strain ATCC 49049 / DSM 4359 / NBRC 107923 / NS-E) TaxID=309803 RepID=B9KA66_THENN|nr:MULTISPECIES: FliA/WhiG family RNA polymerase sigma factor [Thermotoga]MDK2786046.1 polymerase sigma factor FliA [Thermotoga sp.]HBF10735.1 FliA/WhiG family RNA polymerase sigma factor [Thermotoga neapolitana]ACM23849.1 RNA polymerase, sigma 28 subunit, FliA/WhiG [Thermotoga neapolitana DSM 4359]AJG39880.1 RNA polymerase sigma70 [Thermotoga sp. RQ7]KFZ21044.1 RNA polymerase, sigma 28 subunit, FliA/WhiG [Thermotoga neapolitana LA10]
MWDKERAIKSLLPVIKRIAEDLVQTLPPNVEVEDLIQEGILAALSAFERYDPSKASFTTFVIKRVKGAMYDYLRRIDWMPRNLRKNVKLVEKAIHESEEFPSDEELARKTGLELKEVIRAKNEMMRRQILMIDAFDEELALKTEGPDETAYREILKEKIKKAIEKLSEKEKLVLSLRFEKELSLKEIARVLGVSESRVSQIVSLALLKIKREVMGDDQTS